MLLAKARYWFRAFAKHLRSLLPLLALILFVVWLCVERAAHITRPPVGLYIALLAFLAGVEAIWPSENAWTKAGWLMVFGFFLAAEITVLYRQRSEDEARFRESSVKMQDAISYTTGGDTFPWAMPGNNPTGGGKNEIGFWLQSNGKYPLFKVSLSVARAYRSRSNPTQIAGFGGGSIKRDEFEAGSSGAFVVSFPAPDKSPTYYVAIMGARNGQWEEIVEARTVGSSYLFHWVVYGSTSLAPAQIYGPYKKLMDLADNNFPTSARSNITYPPNTQLLDLEPITEGPPRPSIPAEPR